jgi:polyhydroxybutyrate depolymerase
MRKIKEKVILVLCVLICFFASALSGSASAKTLPGSISFAGLKRTYLIYIPPSYDKTKSMPLVIALHGGGGSGRHMIKLTRGGVNALADKFGFIVAYPDGIEKNWNDGRRAQETGYRAHREDMDDVGFIAALIGRLIEEFNVDPKRIYATGMSNGAMMSYRLACQLSEKIAAIAPVTGNIPQNLCSVCLPSMPVSVLAINNVNDPLMPWEGEDITGPLGLKKLGKVLPTAETIRFWVEHNNCSPTAAITHEPDRDPYDGTRIRKESYGNGRDSAEVVLYAVEGGGHTWPNGYQYLGERLVGKTSRDIDANEVIWDFFSRHARE